MDPQKILKRFEELRTARMPYEQIWEEITNLCMPNRGGSFNREETPAYLDDLYDSTGALAAENLVSTLLGGLVNQEIGWLKLKPAGQVGPGFEDIDYILSHRSDELLQLFKDPKASFYTNISEMFMEIVTLGTGALEVFYEPLAGIQFRAIKLRSLYVSTDKAGKVDVVYRRYKIKARNFEPMFGSDIPKRVKRLAKEKPEELLEVIRCCAPNEDFKLGINDQLPFRSVYLLKDGGEVLSDTQLEYFPYIIARWNKLPDEDYGRSPAWTALPDLQMIQAMEFSALEMAQKISSPPIMVADDGVLLPIETHANGVIVGGIDPITGRNRVAPLPFGGSPQLFDAFIERKKDAVRKAFFNNALSLQDRPQMTAEEVITLREEGFRLMSANINRLVEEVLMPLVNTTYFLAERFRIFAPIDEDGEVFELGVPIDIEFMGQLARTAKVNDALAWNRYLQQFLIPLAQVDPTALDILNIDRSAQIIADSLNVPIETLSTFNEVQQIREARAQQQAAAFEMEALEREAKIRSLEGGTEDDGELS